MVRFSVLITVILIAASPASLAQQEREPDPYSQPFRQLEALYQQSLETDTRYINGTVYQDAYLRTNGHQFFNSENWTMGTLVMMGRTYHGIPLKYDLYKDQLLYNHLHKSGSYVLVLNKTRIEGFTIEGHTFTKLAEPNGASTEIDGGIYEVVAEGKAVFYQKWSKRLSEASQHSRREFSSFNEWYILNDGQYHKVTRKPGLLNALGDHEKEIKSYIRESRIVIGVGDEMAIKKVIDHYNSLQ
jgi:hypothetical protein